MIKIYSKSNCPKCVHMKEYMKEAGIEFQELDITNDLVTLMRLREANPGAGFPVLEFDDGTSIAGDIEAMMNKLHEKVE
jgi:glutaredoxin